MPLSSQQGLQKSIHDDIHFDIDVVDVREVRPAMVPHRAPTAFAREAALPRKPVQTPTRGRALPRRARESMSARFVRPLVAGGSIILGAASLMFVLARVPPNVEARIAPSGSTIATLAPPPVVAATSPRRQWEAALDRTDDAPPVVGGTSLEDGRTGGTDEPIPLVPLVKRAVRPDRDVVVERVRSKGLLSSIGEDDGSVGSLFDDASVVSDDVMVALADSVVTTRGDAITRRGEGNRRPTLARSVRRAMHRPRVPQRAGKNEMLAVIHDHQDGLQSCYENALKADATLSGKLVAELTLSARGKVSNPRIVEDSPGNKELAACVVALLKRTVFQAPATKTTLSISVLFRPREPMKAFAPSGKRRSDGRS